MRIGDKIDSDHHPLELKIKGKRRERKGGKGRKDDMRGRKGVWNEEGKEKLREIAREWKKEDWRRREKRWKKR